MDIVTIVLAGGQGSRLFPLTKIRSKPAVPIAGRFRLVDISLSNIIHSGLRKIFVMTQFATESLHRHIFLTYRFDEFTKGFLTILAAQQTLDNRDWYQGTADAVRQNLVSLRDWGDHVLILSGDHLYRMDYTKFIGYHLSKKADISIAVTPVSREQAPDLGVMRINGSGQITAFKEKPKDAETLDSLRTPDEAFSVWNSPPEGRTHLASMGVYLFNLDVLKELLENNDFRDFGRDVIPYAIQTRPVFGYLFAEYWRDIGTIKSFFQANLELTDPLPQFNFYDEDRPIFTQARFLPGSKILSSEVKYSILCEGSIINRSRIERSLIGIRSRVGDQSVLEQTVMMGADFYESHEELDANHINCRPDIGIGRECEVRKAIIDKNARIGHGVRLINARGVAEESAENYVIRDGIIVVPKDGVIPDGTVI